MHDVVLIQVLLDALKELNHWLTARKVLLNYCRGMP